MLQWAIVVSLVGVFVVIPVALLATSSFQGQSRVEDNTRAFYTIEGAVYGIVADLINGADAVPLPPNTYTPPDLEFGEVAPEVFIERHEPETLATLKPILYRVSGAPDVVSGTAPQGGATSLARDDNEYYSLSATGEPQSLSYEVTSEIVGLSTLVFGGIEVRVRAWEEMADVEVFIFNPDDLTHNADGYSTTPDATKLLDHDHLFAHHHDHGNHAQPDSAHTHDIDHDHHHGKGHGVHGHHDDAHHGHDHKDHGHDDDDDHDHGHKHHDYTDQHLLLNKCHESHDHDHQDHPGHAHHDHHKGHGHSHGDHGEETICVSLSGADVAYLNSLPTKTVKIKIVATIVDDPDHHHHIKKNDHDNDDDNHNHGEDHLLGVYRQHIWDS